MSMPNTAGNDDGSLVKQLINAKTQLDGEVGGGNVDDDHRSTGTSRNVHGSSLSGEVQKVTQLIAPMARTLDYLQEDIDSMVSELRLWGEEHKSNRDRLAEGQSGQESELESLKMQVDQLDNDLNRINESIRNRRSSIIRNDERIMNMIRMSVERH